MNLLHDYNIINDETISKTFELSESIEENIYTDRISGLKYGVLRNFYKDPVAVKEFFKNFPLLSKTVSNSPGIQLYFSITMNESLKPVYKYLHNMLQRNKFPCDPQQQFHVPIWETYCNFYWKNMYASRASMTPHFDNFNLGFNIWLTEDVPSGTDFYSYRWKDYEPVYFVEEFRNQSDTEFDDFFRELCEYYEDGEEIDWNPDEIDNSSAWEKYHTIDPEYNTATFYPGIFFHMPSVHPDKYDENFLRHSQVITYAYTQLREYQHYWRFYKSTGDFLK